MGYKVFLSHSTQDADWAKWVHQEATLVGIEVYLFEHDLRPGTYVAEKVQQAIRMCDALMVLLTPNSQDAPYVQQEVGFAQALQKPIIPLVWPGVNSRSLAMLQGREYVRFDPTKATTTLPAVLAYIGTLKAQKELGQAIFIMAALVLAAVGLSKK